MQLLTGKTVHRWWSELSVQSPRRTVQYQSKGICDIQAEVAVDLVQSWCWSRFRIIVNSHEIVLKPASGIRFCHDIKNVNESLSLLLRVNKRLPASLLAN